MKTNYVLYLLSCFLTALFVSCGSGNGDEPYPNPNPNDNPAPSPENRLLNGTKWTTRNWDFDIADDFSWGYVWSDIAIVYFYSNSEGAFYYSRKTLDSDDGRSRSTDFCFFNYNVKGDVVEFDPITPEVFGFPYTLELSNGNLIWGGTPMSKGTIEYSDAEWIYSKRGTVDGLDWYYGSNGTVVIEGTGVIPSYSSYEDTPWSKNTVGSVTIGRNITKIGEYAFASVTIGDVDFKGNNITEIGSHAFQGSCLGTLFLPDNIVTIGSNAFADCKYADINLPEAIETIESSAFYGCKKASLNNTPKLRVIGDYAFFGTEVKSWTNSAVVESIGNGCFTNYKDKSVNLPAITTLCHLAFNGESLNEIHIGANLTNVTGTPFYGSRTGKFYISRGEPLALTHDIVDNASGWTLYVPQGSESAYRKSPYWSNFKSIVGSADLGVSEGGGNEGDTEGVTTYDDAECGIFDVTLHGEINGLSEKQYSFYFELCNDSNFSSNIKSYAATVSGNLLTCYIEDLNPNTDYYYRVMAKFGSEWVSGKIYYFRTKPSNHPYNCTYTIDGVEYKMVKVTGHPNGDFYIMQTELPISAVFVMNNTPIDLYKLDSNGDNHVIKSEFKYFLRELRSKTGIALRLPTKSEWQYAAKGGQLSKGYKYSGSDDLATVGWYNITYPHDPALLAPNELGLYDMSGNYAEVVNDNISDIYYIDGDLCGGNFKSQASECTPTSSTPGLTSGSIPGTRLKEKNAFNGKYNTVRLVFSAD